MALMDGFSDFVKTLPGGNTNGVSANKADKLANTSAIKEQKMAPTLLPDSLTEYAQGETLTLGQIAYYDKTYAEQQSQIQQKRDGFLVENTDTAMGNMANIGVQFGAGAVRTGAQIAAAPFELAAQIAQATIVETKTEQKQRKFAGEPAPFDAQQQRISDSFDRGNSFQSMRDTINQLDVGGTYRDAQPMAEPARNRLLDMVNEVEARRNPQPQTETVQGDVPKHTGKTSNSILGASFKDGDTELGQDVTNAGKRSFIKSVKENVTDRKDKVINKARSLVNTDKEDKLIADLGKDYDSATASFESGNYLKGAAQLVAGGMGSVLTNPSATIGFLAESLPQMLATSIRTPANIAYAVSTAAEGVATFEKTNKREATREEMLKIMAVSGSAAFAEQFSAAKLLPKGAKKTADKVYDSVKKVQKSPLKAKAKAAVAKTASGLTTEAATEGYQTAAEQVAGTLDVNQIDGKEVFTAAAIGGGIGGGISSTGAAALAIDAGHGEVAKFAGKAGRAYIVAQAKARKASPVKVQEAVTKGDVSGEGLTTAEHVEVLLDPTTLPANEEEQHARMADIDSKIDSLMDEAEVSTDPKAQKAILTQITDLNAEADKLASLVVGKPSEIMNDIESIEDAPKGDVDAKENVKRVFNSMRTKPGSVTAAQARTAADSDVVTKAEAKELTQYAELEEAIEAVNVRDVNNDILNGGHGNRGIKQFRSAFNAATTLGDKKGAAKALDALTTFADRHTAKVVAVTAAFNAVLIGSNEAPALVEQVQATYKLGISKGSNNGDIPLITVMNAEMVALNKAVTQMSGKEYVPTPISAPTAQPAQDTKKAPVAKAQFNPEVVKDVNTGIQRINQLVETLVSAKAKVTSSLSKKIAVLDPETSSVAEVQAVLDITAKIAAFNGIQATQTEDKATPTVTPEVTPKEANFDNVETDLFKGTEAKRTAAVNSTPMTMEEKIDAAQNEQQQDFEDGTQTIEQDGVPTNDTTAGLRENTDGTSDTETGSVNAEIATNELRSRKLGLRATVHTLSGVIERGVRGVLAKNFKAKINESNVLHIVENFFDEYNADERIVKDLTAGQKDAMRMLVQLDQGVRTSIRQLFIPIKGKTDVKAGFRKGQTVSNIDFNEDMFQYFAGIDGKIDNNLLGFITVGIADFLASDAQKNVYNDDDSINVILSRKKSTTVGPLAKALLFEAGIVRNQLAESIGANIMNAMGIRANNDADGQLQGNMALAIGQMAIAAMIDQGLVQEVQINSNKMATVKDGLKAKLGDVNAYTSFIRVTTQSNNNGYLKPSEKVMSVVDTIQKSDAVLTNVFGVTNKETGPSFTIPTAVVEIIKGTFQLVNQTVRDVIEKHQKRPHYAKQAGLNVWGFLPEEAKRKILGYEEDMLANAHVYHHPTVIGVNNEIERSIENVENFVTKMLGEKAGLAAKFFMSHEVWKNGRLGMISNTINLQGDKLHRHLFGMDAWNMTIDPTDEFMVIQAKLAIAEGFGIKVDKNTLGATLAAFDELVKSKVIKDAIASVKVVNGKKSVQARTTDKHIDNIMAAIEMGGEKAYTLDALTNLAKMSTSEPFEFDLFREVDGITNGVAIGTWQLGAADNEIDMERRLAKTGIYFVEDGGTFGERNTVKGTLDSYEDLSVAWEKFLAPMRKAPAKPDQGREITKDEAQEANLEQLERWHAADLEEAKAAQRSRDAGRAKIANANLKARRTQLNALRKRVNEGTKSKTAFVPKPAFTIEQLAALETIVLAKSKDGMITRAMSKNPLMITNYGAAIQGVINAFAEDAVGDMYKSMAKAANQKELDAIMQRVSVVTGSEFKAKFGEHLNKLMTPAQDTAFRDLVSNTYGVALEQALNSKYAAFQDARTKVNQAVSVMFDMFDIRYKDALEDAQKDGKILSNDQRQELVMTLYEQVPLFNNYFSMKSGNREEMTLGMKTRKVRQNGVNEFKNKQKYAKPLPGSFHPKTGKPINSDTGYSSINEYEDAGVAPMILAIHGIDAATMVKMLDSEAGLNVHDAYAFGLDVVIDGTKKFNKGFGDVMKELSIVKEVRNATADAMKAFKKAANPGQMREFNKRMKARKLEGGSDFATYEGNHLPQLDTIQNQKDRTTERVKVISQYHTETGAHNVGEGQTQDVLDEILFQDLSDMIVEEEIQEVLGLVEPTDAQVRYFDGLTEADKSQAEVVTKAAKMLVITAGKNLKANNKPSKERDLKGTLHLNSGIENIDTNNFHEIYSNDVRKESAMDIFRDLSTMGTKRDSAGHLRVLSATLSTLSAQILTPIALKLADIQGQETHGVFTDAKIFINNSVGNIENGIQMSANEVYVHEVIHAVTAEGINGASWAARELKKLFDIAEKGIKVTDFLNSGTHIGSPDYATELAAAQLRYDHIFNNPDGTHLDEFVALGLSNENFMRALGKIDGTTINRNPKTVVELVLGMFNHLVNALTARITQTGRMKADAKLRALAEQLAGIDHRKKSKIYTAYDKSSAFVTDNGKKLIAFITAPLVALINSDFVKQSRFKTVRGAGKIARMVQNDSTKEFFKIMQRVMSRFKWMRDGLLAQLVTEVKGRTDVNGYMHTLSRLSNKTIDQARLAIQTNVTAHLLSMFANSMDTDTRNALGRALLKTDAVTLTEQGYSIDEVADMFTDSKVLADNMKAEMNILRTYGANTHFYLKQAENMGLMMAKGISREHLTLRNAKNIANLMDTGGQVNGDLDKATQAIDALATMWAIKFTDERELKLAASVIRTEVAIDPKLNGIGFMLAEHANTKEDARVQNFIGSESMIVKGHTKQILDPDVRITTATEQELPEFLAANWKVVKKLKHDPSHPLAGTALYQIVNTDGLLAKYESGVASLTSEKANGSDLIKVRSQLSGHFGYKTIQEDAHAIHNAKAQLISDMFSAKDTRVPVGVSMLVQIHNDQGGVSGYRYMMTEANKVHLMGKSDDFAQVLGHMKSGVKDKVESRKINEQVIVALKKDWDDTAKTDRLDFVTIGPTTPYAEVWNMMPQAMKNDVLANWGADEFMIRRDMVRLVFGQRKWSTSQMKRIDLEDKKALAQVGALFNNGVVGLFNMIGTHRVRFAEQAWQEVISVVKDKIVIATGSVTAGNIGSNLILLRTMGVSNKDITRDHALAINGAVRYKRDKLKIDILKRNLKNGFSKDVKRDEVLIARLTTELERNPIHALAKAGMFKAIVEDIDLVDDQYSKATKLEEAVKPFTDKVPQIIKDVTNTVMINQDTKMYKFMRETAQLSDFVARYTLHTHNMNQKNKDGSPKYTLAESLDIIEEVFIDYDLPTHKGIQYANDMGFLMFTKFFIRIQKVIMRIMRDHPGNTLATVLLQQQLGDYSEILDSSVVGTDLLGKINNPLALIPAIVDIPTINLVR